MRSGARLLAAPSMRTRGRHGALRQEVEDALHGDHVRSSVAELSRHCVRTSSPRYVVSDGKLPRGDAVTKIHARREAGYDEVEADDPP